MAVHELRRLNFFHLSPDTDKGVVEGLLKDTQLKLATSGHGNFILGDNEGNVHILNKNFKSTTFRAYNVKISLIEYVKHSPFLVAVGEDEVGINPLLKIWNTDKIDKNGNPMCVRITRLAAHHKAVVPSAVAIHESTVLLAVGFEDGSILLYRGDISRDRNSKPKVLKDSGGSGVTGLSFKTSAKYSHLFATSSEQTYFYDITSKDKEMKVVLDDVGCQPGCSIMVESPHGSHYMVGMDDGIYCYTSEGKGRCYPVQGEKVLIQWSKSYLVVVAKDDPKVVNDLRPGTSSSSNTTSSENHTITILDLQNKLIVFSTVMKSTLSVLVEWGCFYIVTKDLKIHQVSEKDVQSKLALLFKKNLYDVAIRMAKSQHYDEEGLVDIFRQYGDHLYLKGDRLGAIEQYIKTIGKLEPSYIIRRFMDSAHMEQLMEYLQALHRAGQATGDHTTLLLNCYTKLGRTADLENFIMTKDREYDFDIEIALKVVRGVNITGALQLAKAHGRHVWVLRILLEDLKEYSEAVAYIAQLGFYDAEQSILEFGDVLIANVPDKTTEFLKSFCTDSKARKPKFDGFPEPKPQDFLHLFLNQSKYLVDFLECLVHSGSGWDTQIYNVLIEHYLVMWSKEEEGSWREHMTQRVMKLLENPDMLYDKDQVFILCQTYDFSPGTILLYEKNKMYHQIVQHHMKQNDFKAMLATCKRHGHQDPYLWIQALWLVANTPDSPPSLLADILAVIEREKLLSPSLTVDTLGDTQATLGHARSFLNSVLQAEEKLVAQETAMIEKYSAETERIRAHIHDTQTSTTVFQASRCSVCERQLELPSIHFLCQHSYHYHCFQSYAEQENECIACRRNNKQLLDMIHQQEQSHELHEEFHSDLEKADDGFSVVAKYFGSGVFNSLSLDNRISTTQRAPLQLEDKSKIESSVPGSISRSTPPRRSPVPEVKPASRGQYSTTNSSETLSGNLAKAAEVLPVFRAVQPGILSATVTSPTSQLEDYDEAKNPFADEDSDFDSNNPFKPGDPYDYDKELNPFA